MKNTLTIARYTFTEVYRSKIMVGLVLLALSVLLITYVSSEFAYGAAGKVALDFGIGAMSLSNIFIAIFLGATLISKEIETKTLYMIISRPISRSAFLAGKIIGLSSVLIFNTIFLTLVSSMVFVFLDGKFTNMILWTGFFSLFESFILLLFAVLFSLISNVTMSVIFSIFILVSGHTITATTRSVFAKINILFIKILSIASWIIPDLERFNTKDFLIYQQTLSLDFLGVTFLYGVLYLGALAFLITYIFNNKNLD